jgi:hypothetical protein
MTADQYAELLARTRSAGELLAKVAELVDDAIDRLHVYAMPTSAESRRSSAAR